jgi:endonuclease/exonuclease/phosphatase (EEP) superfamily protein YafD
MLRRFSSWLLSGVLGSVGCANPGDAPASALVLVPTDAPRLRVATFNVNFGVADAAANLDAIRRIDADVVLLQEVTGRSEPSYRLAFEEQYPHILFRDCCGAGGLAVLSKFPLSDARYLEPDAGWFPAWLATVQSPLGAVQLLNVHLRPPVSDSGSWVVGQFSTRSVRRAEIEGFWDAVDPDLPVVVVGDFNEGADGQAIDFLGEHGLRSALAQTASDADTWHWRTRFGELTAMLDHIVYDPRLSLLQVSVDEDSGSDHYPVVADFSLADGE